MTDPNLITSLQPERPCSEITWQTVQAAAVALVEAFPEIRSTVDLPTWMKTRCLEHTQKLTKKSILASPPSEVVSPLTFTLLELGYLLGWITKMVLVHGAANQLVDIEASRGESVSQLQRLRLELHRKEEHLSPSDRKAKHLSAISDSGAGNCAEHSLITLGVLASTGLNLDTTLYHTNNDHGFIMIHADDPLSPGGRTSVVIDSWAVIPIPHLIKDNCYFSADRSIDLAGLLTTAQPMSPQRKGVDSILPPQIASRPMILAHIANTLSVKTPMEWRQRYYHDPATNRAPLPPDWQKADRYFFDVASALLGPSPPGEVSHSSLPGNLDSMIQSLGIRDTLLCTLKPFQRYVCQQGQEDSAPRDMGWQPEQIPRFYLDRLNAAAHFEETQPDKHQALIAHLKSPPY